MMNYKSSELERQVGFRAAGGFAPGSDAWGDFMGKHRPFVFPPAHAAESLFAESGESPTTRERILEYFESFGWHRAHGHLLSSQVSCVNHLGPFMHRPKALGTLLAPLFDGIAPEPIAMPNEAVRGEPNFVAFEWIGETDHLNEAEGDRPRTRGANCTSIDAVVLVRTQTHRELLLIEWKYTESYGPRLSGGERARRVRDRRYADLAFAPHGPIKADLDLWLTDFFYEPLYQMLRQQMLATQLELHKVYDVDRVRTIHVSPAGNTALGTVTSRELKARHPSSNVFDLWPSLLVSPDRFVHVTQEALFGGFDAAAYGMGEWREYLRKRYALR